MLRASKSFQTLMDQTDWTAAELLQDTSLLTRKRRAVGQGIVVLMCWLRILHSFVQIAIGPFDGKVAAVVDSGNLMAVVSCGQQSEETMGQGGDGGERQAGECKW